MQIAYRPGGTEFVVSTSLAFEAGTMAGSQPRGFVEEEELRVAVRCHDRPMSTPEFQLAHQPPLPIPGSPYAPTLVVEDSPVAQHRPPVGAGDDLAERRHSVLPGHR
jgi:hypothetical protein